MWCVHVYSLLGQYNRPEWSVAPSAYVSPSRAGCAVGAEGMSSIWTEAVGVAPASLTPACVSLPPAYPPPAFPVLTMYGRPLRACPPPS
jgi:hypothetical protein